VLKIDQLSYNVLELVMIELNSDRSGIDALMEMMSIKPGLLYEPKMIHRTLDFYRDTFNRVQKHLTEDPKDVGYSHLYFCSECSNVLEEFRPAGKEWVYNEGTDCYNHGKNENCSYKKKICLYCAQNIGFKRLWKLGYVCPKCYDLIPDKDERKKQYPWFFD